MPTSDDKYSTTKPELGERLQSHLSIHGLLGESTGGIPELTNSDYAAAIGSLPGNLMKIAMGAKYGGWQSDREQLIEIVTRRSWNLWRETHNQSNLNISLNTKIARLVASEFQMTHKQRMKIPETQRAKTLGMDHRRFKRQIKGHVIQLAGWLDAVETDALKRVSKKLRR